MDRGHSKVRSFKEKSTAAQFTKRQARGPDPLKPLFSHNTPLHFIHPSNLLTYCSFTGALFAAFFALNQNISLTGLFLGIAALSDMLDGRFAGLFKRTAMEKSFGAQIDSLSDAVSFGLAPIICLMALSLPEEAYLKWFWFMTAIYYLTSALTRLAFYNLFSDSKEAPLTGVPTTFCGLIWPTLLLTPQILPWAPLFFIALGTLMIAPLKIQKPRGKVMLLFIGWGITLIVIHYYTDRLI